MRKAVLLALFVALVLPVAAQARVKMHENLPYQRAKLYDKINLLRERRLMSPLAHGWLRPNLEKGAQVHADSIMTYGYWPRYNQLRLNVAWFGFHIWAPWYTFSPWIGGETIVRNRCHGLPLTAEMVKDHILSHPKALAALVDPNIHGVGIHFHKFRSTAGIWKGKGVCRNAVILYGP